MLTRDTEYLINPTGKLVVGGPQGDCGLTGRKIIVDMWQAKSVEGNAGPVHFIVENRPVRAVISKRK